MKTTQNIATSERLFAEACAILPGGVNSPARAFRAVGGTPRFITGGHGAYLTDADGNKYIDYVLSFGPNILGHAAEPVVKAVQEQVTRGFSFGAPTEAESILAQKIQQFMPNLEMLRFVNSGTEAVMSALRVARGFTKRDLIVKFDGQYHGHADAMLAKAGSGVATLGISDSPGVPASNAGNTIVAPFNDIGALETIFSTFGDQIAAIIMEPVAGNMGLVLPVDGYLEQVRTLTERYGSLLIFDEVMTGFRVHPGGVQTLYKVKPDLTTLGKVIGGGLPVGAYGGRRDIMEIVAPSGPVYQAGTMSGNPVAMAAGIAVLEVLEQQPEVWSSAADAAATLARGVREIAEEKGVAIQVPQIGTMLSLFFSETPVTDWMSVAASETKRFTPFFHGMLERGVYLPPSPFETWFTSVEHRENEIDKTFDSLRSVLT